MNEERAFKRNSARGAPMLEGALNRQQPGFSTTFRDKSNFQLFKDQPFVRTIGFQLCDFFVLHNSPHLIQLEKHIAGKVPIVRPLKTTAFHVHSPYIVHYGYGNKTVCFKLSDVLLLVNAFKCFFAVAEAES